MQAVRSFPCSQTRIPTAAAVFYELAALISDGNLSQGERLFTEESQHDVAIYGDYFWRDASAMEVERVVDLTSLVAEDQRNCSGDTAMQIRMLYAEIRGGMAWLRLPDQAEGDLVPVLIYLLSHSHKFHVAPLPLFLTTPRTLLRARAGSMSQ